ncbi:FAD-dependent oxidoreductase [Calothrix sp. PCC 7507]|uniref:FAD-dependent oxidoreductase n=1 Tax=Calothrix sp. PCC 7507 TaxID=99598 RepID=UPI00029F46BA|nr:FAD-dependent oxidoreductase [Calothrix sp. PCC 7507]AFY35477.1 D-amino-acid:oxygen oxidoreductase (deaminating) [Calothrix sp. PCC 7507]
MQARVLVIGGGVSGLTTALCLLQDGFAVTVVSEKFAPNNTSVVAGALWEWPPAVCGSHRHPVSLERSKSWCMVSYNKFLNLAANKETGVYNRDVVFYYKKPIEQTLELQKMNELQMRVLRFRRDKTLIDWYGINRDTGVVDAYTYLAPQVDTDIYMQWLYSQVKESGCKIVEAKISGNLAEIQEQLKSQFSVDIIVNCSGLGSIELTNDDMYPLRGALIRVKNDGVSMPRVTTSHCMTFDNSVGGQNMIFILPRGEKTLLLGGLVEPDKWELDINLENYEPIQDMWNRCLNFMPSLKDATIDAAEPVRVGLRPGRKDNIRLERELGTDIIHNYGHGGSGVTLSWGCAQEVVQIVKSRTGAQEVVQMANSRA